MTRKLLKRGNLKLSSKQGIWTLPRSTCIGAGECAKWCYAKKMENLKNVREGREWRLEQSKRDDFVQKMIDEIVQRNFKIIRIHEAGDFYCKKYLNKWSLIAQLLPDVRFYAFTKAFQLDFSHVPDNLVILQSYGSKHDHKINKTKNTAKVIETVEEKRKSEYLCPYYLKHSGGFTKCGESCSFCFSPTPKVKHVVFFKH